MQQKQEVIDISRVDIINKTQEMKDAGYRLTHIIALKDLTLRYGFEKGGEFVVVRVSAGNEYPVESISGIYSYAFTYENEIKELFGIEITNINQDFGGHFYKTAVKMPFVANPEKSVKAW